MEENSTVSVEVEVPPETTETEVSDTSGAESHAERAADNAEHAGREADHATEAAEQAIEYARVAQETNAVTQEMYRELQDKVEQLVQKMEQIPAQAGLAAAAVVSAVEDTADGVDPDNPYAGQVVDEGAPSDADIETVPGEDDESRRGHFWFRTLGKGK